MRETRQAATILPLAPKNAPASLRGCVESVSLVFRGLEGPQKIPVES